MNYKPQTTNYKLAALALLLAGCTVNQSRHAVAVEPLVSDDSPVAGRVIDDFDSAGAWHYYEVDGSVHPLAWQADGVMRLTSDSSAGLLWRETRYDPQAEPLLQWRWSVDRTFDNSNPFSPEFDNFPARFLVGFDSGWKGAGPVALEWRKKVEAATGVTPPARAICYTFGGALDAGEAVDAAFGEGRIVVINLRPRGAEGQRFSEVRDIAADYRAIFGEPAPTVMALGLGCDSHRVKLKASAEFDFIRVYGPEAYSQFRRELAQSPERRAPLLTWLILAGCGLLAAASAGAWLWLRARDKAEPAKPAAEAAGGHG
jgi:hypothetical protein